MNEARRFLSQQCETSREWVSLRLDDELSELEDAMLRRHGASCADCRAFAAAAEAFTVRLRGASLETPPEALAPVFEAAPQRRERRRFAGVGAVAAALAAAAAVFFAPGPGSHSSSTSRGQSAIGTADVSFDAQRAGQRARMRLPEAVADARVRFIELT